LSNSVSLDVQTGGLQMFLECQKQRSNAEKYRKRMSDSLLKFFWKNSSKPLSSSSPLSSSNLVGFEWLKIWWMRQLRLYKTSLYFRGKDAMIKDFKLKILICSISPIIEHWTPLHRTRHIFPPITLLNWEIFAALEALGEGIQMFFQIQKQRNNVPVFTLLWILKCLLTSLSTLYVTQFWVFVRPRNEKKPRPQKSQNF